MSLNTRLFFKINSLVGRNKLLDFFGKAGAEYAIILLIAWYVGTLFVVRWPLHSLVFWQLMISGVVWFVGWLINLGVGRLVLEPRPHITFPESKILFTPLMSWKSFPSDHALSAWLIVFLAVAFGLPGLPIFVLLAVWVSWGRVFAGVHYPIDILGGFAVAGLTAGGLYALVIYIILPSLSFS